MFTPKNVTLDHLEKLPKETFFEKALLNLPDENLLADLTIRRGNGRNDYPLSILWKGLLAYVAFKCTSIEDLKKQIEKTPLLQTLFPSFPPPSSFSRFSHLLNKCDASLKKLHSQLLERVCRKPVLAIGFFQGTHLLWDTFSKLPLYFEKAKPNEPPEAGALRLLSDLYSSSPQVIQRAEYLIGDSSYENLIESTWDLYRLKPIIPLDDRPPSKTTFRNAQYDEKGGVYCIGKQNPNSMIFAGFEKDRMSLKYRCMANHYGTSCGKEDNCPLWKGLRIPLSTDRKIFTPLPRSSYRWKSIFKTYETKDALEKMLYSFPNRKYKQRVQLYSLLLLAASLADHKVDK
ncbi:MAG: hypothetical protein COT85_03430 [Chlamydiae bacterium CG10_big_fil_rev_8_21_14_0_10_42_34]|nr:MAG: hypothetical protein COT85_03430 [Chlamydiae bacterium CG10_big_fil_rev_8_21_14_0_10_42_34]